tara:strand:- start:67372 stop:67746 length:375 start_codon:yes stop_codon:yes gene_type:complete
MKIKVTKSKPIAKALIIKSKGSLPMGPSSITDMVGGPMSMLMKSLMSGGMGKMTSMPSMMGKDPEYNDRQMVLSSLNSIRAICDELEQLACGCDPMPSWAEAKIYAAQKDILTVLGALLGKKRG